MFPDCPAQPANILRSRYPRSRAGERKPPRGPLLTLAEEPPAPAPPGSPRPAECSAAGRGSQSRARRKGRWPSHFGERLEEPQQRPARALGAERLRCRSRVLSAPSAGNFTTRV